DLAVAVVIGGAFTAIVNAVVSSIIHPLVSLFFTADAAGNFGPQMTSIYGDPVTFPLGALISAIICYLAVALVVYFVFVLPMIKYKERQAAKNPAVEEATLQRAGAAHRDPRRAAQEQRSLTGLIRERPAPSGAGRSAVCGSIVRRHFP